MNARLLVMRRLVTLTKSYPDLPPGALSHSEGHSHGLAPRDAALAIAIEQAVIRYWNALVVVIQQHLSRPWIEVEHGLQAALLAGSAQLLLMDKIPDHAAINESVEWAKINIRPKAGGFVNAVLRRVMEMRAEIVPQIDNSSRSELPLPDGRAVRFTKDVFSADPLQRLAEQTSHPPALLQNWSDRFGREQALQLALHSLIQPPIIITGIDPAAAAELTTTLLPHDNPGSFVFTGEHSQLLDILSRHPNARVQDPTTALSMEATASLKPKTIIDYCAGRGTKSRQLALLHPTAKIIATDINNDRRSELQMQFSQHRTVTVAEPDQLLRRAGIADLLVLDVPCSNSGVFARRLEAKHRISPESLRSLADLQKQIIADSIPLLRPTGRLLYCTCSIEPMENEDVVAWLNKWHGFDVSLSQTKLPEGVPGDASTRYKDGGFFALLNR